MLLQQVRHFFALLPLEADKALRERSLLHPMWLTRTFFNVGEKDAVRPVLSVFKWFTFMAVPVIVLILAEARFLPFHSPSITWWHRTLIVLDLLIPAFFTREQDRLMSSFDEPLFGSRRFEAIWLPSRLALRVGMILMALLVTGFLCVLPGEALEAPALRLSSIFRPAPNLYFAIT